MMIIKPTLAAIARLSLSTRILAGLALGIFTGLFFGESAAVLQPVSDIYIRLMQMTVLPYLVMSLIVGFGQLEADEARRLAARAGTLLVMVLLLTCVVITAMPAAFPGMQSASFFSTALVEPSEPFPVADLFFTANPFNSLSNAVIPAVVLFSSLIGIGLIGVEERDRVLGTLRALNASIVRITGFIINLTPYGVFAISAVAAGTTSLEIFERLSVYFITFGAASLLLTFLVLPLMVTALTPFRYGEVVGIAKDALLTAFVTNNAFIVLPILVERSRFLLQRRGLLGGEADSAPDVLIPILFNFPNAGRLLTLLFIPFAAWLAGNSLTTADYPGLFAIGVPSYFAKAQVALPFLLDYFGLPHDLFQLYIPTTIVTGKFDAMVTAMNLLVFALLGAAAMGGFLVWQHRRVLAAGAVVAAGLAVTVIGMKLLLAATIDTSYHQDQALRRMHTPRAPSSMIVHRHHRSWIRRQDTMSAPTLAQIRQRGTLRIGYDPDNLPFSFFNLDDELVGFDIELGESLAESLGVRAEFVPVDWRKMPDMLADRSIDAMPSTWVRPYWFSSVRLSVPYLTGTMGLVVRDERRHEFGSVDALRKSHGLKIGVPLDVSQVKYSIERYFGEAEVELVPLDSAQPFFQGGYTELDAFLEPAENASAWTLLHPEFTVVVPQPNPVKIPSAFGMALDADELENAVNEWVVFASNEGLIDRAYDYWILGKGAEDTRPRWSILRNVLGWGD